MSRAQPPRTQKLPRGRHGLSREFVVHNQRERIIRALVESVAENGYTETTVADIVVRAGVSRKTFYVHFRDKEDCFLQAYEVILAQLMAVVVEAYARPPTWPQRIRAGLHALLEFLAGEPEIARAGLVEVLAAGPRALDRYEQALRGFVQFFEAGREVSRHSLPEHISDAVVGGIAQVLYLQVVAGRAEQLLERLDDLVYFALIPFVGHGRAREAVSTARGAERPGA